jgi:hypothetical protein
LGHPLVNGTRSVRSPTVNNSRCRAWRVAGAFATGSPRTRTTTGRQEELKRLSLAEKVLQGVARHKHVDSRLPALIDLVLSRPLISAELAQRELKLTSTGFRRLRAQLGTSVKELSDRGRYQVWGIL